LHTVGKNTFMGSIIKKKAWAIILLIGVALAIMGILQGDYRDNLLKAMTICLECIGIG